MKKLEAPGGLEPPIKVLQTSALPLGHDAKQKKLNILKNAIAPFQSESILRAGDGIRTHGLLLGKETLYHLTTPANRLLFTESAESQNRTGDTAIFSRVLYQLS